MTTDTNEMETVERLAQQAARGEELEPGLIYAFRLGDRVHQIDLTGDQYREVPKRKRGTVVVRDVPSFLAYYAKHSDEHTEVYADREHRTITAVLDAHQADAARWGQHRLGLQLTHSESFHAWAGHDRKTLPQLAFAEFVEDHRSDITSPPAAELLELAQSFEATTKVTFRSGTRLKSGQRTLSYVEEQNASGGSGDLVIPDEFDLVLPIFEGASVADPLTARLRFRINDGKLFMVYVLDRLAEAIDAAFEGVVSEVDEGVSVPILRGVPA